MAEQRRYERAPVTIDASYLIPSDPQSYHKSTVVNISQGGLGMVCADDIPLETEIQILMFFDLHNRSTIKMRTVWSKKIKNKKVYQIGLVICQTHSPDVDMFLDFYSKELARRKTTK